MTVKAVSAPNIALIKYWGNRNDALRLPAADSLSMTLDSPTVEVTMEWSDVLTVHSFNPDGSEHALGREDMHRFEQQFMLGYEYLQTIGMDYLPVAVKMEIRSHVPSGIGLASSAAVFSAVARAYKEILRNYVPLDDRDLSILSRLGSGSASRSTYGGFVALKVEGDAIGDAYAAQIANENHWNLHDIIIAPTAEAKKVGSSEGHPLAKTSEHFKDRLKHLPQRQSECIEAILKKDFEKLMTVSEEDCLDMHLVMETSNPPLQYLNKETKRIVREVEALRKEKHLEVLYTMDAGPTVHLICTDDAKKSIEEFADAQKGCTIFKSKIGPGSRLL